jgi:hypothetical protein
MLRPYIFLLRRCSAIAAAEFFRKDVWQFPKRFFKLAVQPFPREKSWLF